jgi:hypothetical protein
MVVRPIIFQNGLLRNSALKTARRFGQKCHTRSFSDSGLLREARILHYVPTSRSARIVVTPLHESPGPTTAGASLFCPSQFPRSVRSYRLRDRCFRLSGEGVISVACHCVRLISHPRILHRKQIANTSSDFRATCVGSKRPRGDRTEA